MKENVGLLLFFVVILVGCAGRQPEPVSAYMPGDENLSCDSLEQQISTLQKDMLALLPKTDKTVINTLWNIGGTVASNTTPVGMATYLFINMKDAERIEYEAFRRRHNRLLLIAESKNCDMGDVMAEPIPSLAERKAMGKEAKKSKSSEKNSSE